MNLTVEQLKELVVKKNKNIYTNLDYDIIDSFDDEIEATLDKENLPLQEKIKWAEKEYYINLFLQSSEKKALSRIMWEYWGSSVRYCNDLETLKSPDKRLAYGSFFDRYNQPTFEEFKNGAPLHKEATADESAMAL